jgi:hypothetical protein
MFHGSSSRIADLLNDPRGSVNVGGAYSVATMQERRCLVVSLC